MCHGPPSQEPVVPLPWLCLPWPSASGACVIVAVILADFARPDPDPRLWDPNDHMRHFSVERLRETVLLQRNDPERCQVVRVYRCWRAVFGTEGTYAKVNLVHNGAPWPAAGDLLDSDPTAARPSSDETKRFWDFQWRLSHVSARHPTYERSCELLKLDPQASYVGTVKTMQRMVKNITLRGIQIIDFVEQEASPQKQLKKQEGAIG